ncbi:MAG: VCBS repeat-containing protein, partial [Spirochaetes bacterium]|nr:VCBS repeat-containing protein [Spirochaetota bacterium]
NGNGNLDLVVGANSFNSGQGEVYIFNNNGSGISSGDASSANTILNGEAANGFGLSLSIRDINRDNYPDLIVAEGNSTINQGWVYIFHNGDTGISSGGSSTANTILSGDVGFYFGSAIDF